MISTLLGVFQGIIEKQRIAEYIQEILGIYARVVFLLFYIWYFRRILCYLFLRRIRYVTRLLII